LNGELVGQEVAVTDLLPHPTLADIVLRREALAAGYTDRDIAKMVRSGHWHRVRHGAYVGAKAWNDLGDVEQHALLARAVLKQARAQLVLSHISALPEYAAPMWGLPRDCVHVTRRDRHAGRKESGVCQHQGLLLPGDVELRRGVEVTSAARTAIDITTVATTEQSLVVVNHLLHHAHTTLEAVRARYAGMDQNPFTLHTDLVLRLADPRIESVGESRTFFLCWSQGLPVPQPQFIVNDELGREYARLDFAWPELGVWLEFDGKEKYVKYLRDGESVADAVLREKGREDRIRELTGWRCVRISWADLFHPERTAARIRSMLG
jgi:hypothetical protein